MPQPKYTYSYPKADHTTDLAVFAIHELRLEVLLIKREDEPFANQWAFPGGFIKPGEEDLDGAARRKLEDETKLDLENIYVEQLYTFSDPKRDPRGHVISTAYVALVPSNLYGEVKAASNTKDARWFRVEELLTAPSIVDLAFDHSSILNMAVMRVRGKIDYAPSIAAALLTGEFSQTEFRQVHEILKGEKYDASNFNKRFRRMVSDEVLVKTQGTRHTGGRSASLYRLGSGAGLV